MLTKVRDTWEAGAIRDSRHQIFVGWRVSVSKQRQPDPEKRQTFVQYVCRISLYHVYGYLCSYFI
jgi:hypothetical protein